MRPIPLSPDPHAPFPPAALALREPDGLLAFGGDLSPPRLLNAYRHGIFPWYSTGQPILWWSPDPRMVFPTASLHLPRRLRRSLRQQRWQLSADTAFDAVVAACASVPRRGQAGTWILPEMRAAYSALHRLGHAHSVEVFEAGELIGGIYGVAVGRMFFGESMFSRRSGASSAALAGLCQRLAQWGWPLLDAQVVSAHLQRLGAVEMPRAQFLAAIAELVQSEGQIGPWTAAFAHLDSAGVQAIPA